MRAEEPSEGLTSPRPFAGASLSSRFRAIGHESPLPIYICWTWCNVTTWSEQEREREKQREQEKNGEREKRRRAIGTIARPYLIQIDFHLESRLPLKAAVARAPLASTVAILLFHL